MSCSEEDSESETEDYDDYCICLKDEEYNKYNKLTELIIFDNETKNKIGYVKGVVIRLDKASSLSFNEIKKLLSYKDKETEEEIINFYKKIIYNKNKKDTIFYITEFFLEKEFRGSGIGSYVISDIMNLAKKYISEKISTIYLMPGPLEKNKEGYVECIKDKSNLIVNNLKNKLISFYSKNGFKNISNTEFFYMNCS